MAKRKSNTEEEADVQHERDEAAQSAGGSEIDGGGTAGGSEPDTDADVSGMAGAGDTLAPAPADTQNETAPDDEPEATETVAEAAEGGAASEPETVRRGPPPVASTACSSVRSSR